MESQTDSELTPVTRGSRLGNFTWLRAEVRRELEVAFTGQKELQAASEPAANRSNQMRRRFEQTLRSHERPRSDPAGRRGSPTSISSTSASPSPGHGLRC